MSDKLICEGCGEYMHIDDAIRCEVCDFDFCPNCAKNCVSGKDVCEGCLEINQQDYDEDQADKKRDHF